MAAMKNAAIIFDFDDTLVRSHQLFLSAQQEFCRRMQALDLYDAGLLNAIEEQDIANVRAAGYLAPECFSQALGQTYEHYCVKYGHAAQAEEKERLMRLGWQPYELPPPEMPGARALLTELKSARYSGYRLLLYTQGEPAIQQKRLAACGFGAYFDVIKIVPVKDTAALQELMAEQHIDAARSWYVGNSLRHDINPAIAVGLNAVHFAIKAWSYEHEPPCGGYHTINKLVQFTALLQEQTEAAR